MADLAMGPTGPTEPLHRQDFAVHSYEVDTEGHLAPRALFAFLQEAAGGDAARGGYTMERLAEDGLVWMIQWMRVEIARPARRGETLAVTTWARRLDRALAWREFEVVDSSRARVAVGTSRWAVVDVEARRLVRLPVFVRRSPVPDRPPALDRGPSTLAPAEPAELEYLGEFSARAGSRFDLVPVPNRLMGESVTVTGLLGGNDILSAVGGKVRGILYVPSVTLRDAGDLFLDGLSPAELSRQTGAEVRLFDPTPRGFFGAVYGGKSSI